MDSCSSKLCCSRVNCLTTSLFPMSPWSYLDLSFDNLPGDSSPGLELYTISDFSLFQDMTPWFLGFPVSHNNVWFPVELDLPAVLETLDLFTGFHLKSFDDMLYINQTHRSEQSIPNNDIKNKIFTKQGVKVRSLQITYEDAKLQSALAHHCSETCAHLSLGSYTGNIPLAKEPWKCLPILQARKSDKELWPWIPGNTLIQQSRMILTMKLQARRCSLLIKGTHYCICQFNRNHFKLLVPDKGIKFYLVISIETKEFAEKFGIWLLNHILLNVIFKNQHWFSKTGSWKQEEPDRKKGVTVNRYSLLISWYF